VAWLWPSAANGQLIQRSQTTGQGGGLSTQSTVKNFGIVGQQIVGASNNGSSSLKAGFIYTIATPCLRPVNFKMEGVARVGENNSIASLSWINPAGQATVEIRYKIDGTIAWTTVNATGTTYQLTNLLDGVRYVVQIRSACSATFFSPYSDLIFFNTEGAPACKVPGPLTLTSVSNNEQQLTWQSTGATSYEVRYRLKGNLAWTFVGGITAATVSLTGLAAGMTYETQIRGLCNGITTVYSDIAEFTTSGASVCELPQGIVLKSAESTSAVIEWTHAGAESYQIRYRLKSATIWTAVNTTAKTITLTDLDPGMTYIYTIRAICNASTGLNSLLSDPKEFSTTGLPSCEVPANIVATAGINSAMVKWDASNGAVSYDLRYRVEGTSVWTIAKSTSGTIELNGLNSGTSYQLQVRSICNAEATLTSVYSNNFSFVTDGAPACVAPMGLLATANTSAAVLTWTAQAGSFGYEVRYKLEGTAAWNYVLASANSISIASLQSGMPYMWSVRTICDEAKTLASPYAETAYFETSGEVACAVPTSLTITDITDRSATVSWSASGATSYQVRYRLEGTSIWTLISSASATTTLSALESGMPYQVQVKAICQANGSLQSLFGDPVSFRTVGLPSCGVPSNLTTSGITMSSATLSWASVEDAINFQVRYRVKGTSLWNTITTSNNQYELAGLEPGMTYQFAVRSNCSADPAISSVFSLPAEFSTSGLPSCEIPTAFNVSAGETDAEILWNNSGALNYEIRYRVNGSTVWINLISATSAINLASLYSNTEYQYQVRSVCLLDGTLKSAYSQVETFTTTGVVSCAVPMALSISSITTSGALVQWAQSGGVKQYDIRYRVKGTTLWKQVLSSVPSVTLAGLSSGMPYQIRIRTICSTDNSLVSAYSAIEEFTTAGTVACEIPVNLQTAFIDVSSATLTWNAAVGALGYEVLYRKKGDLVWTSAETAFNSISITGLLSSTSYESRVRTLCVADKSLVSQYSSIISFTTASQPSGNAGRIGKDTDAKSPIDQEPMSPELNVTIFPNPFTDHVNIQVTPTYTDSYKIAIYSLSGKKVADIFQGQLIADKEEGFLWTPHDQPAGIYLFKMVGRRGREINKKLILAH
jgi:hypothetical protein